MLYLSRKIEVIMIKSFIINRSLKTVSTMYQEYDPIKMDEIRYGLEAVYLCLTKVFVILFVTFLLGFLKEAIILLLFFNGLRAFAFGIHASKSWMCWIASSILFIGFPYLCINLYMPDFVYYIIMGLSMMCFILYAPADTKKRPLVRKNRRLKFKILTIIVSSIYIALFIFTDSMFIKNTITCAMLIESVLIHPLTYRVFKLPYKNYERYVFSK